ncbi:hypothetical protein HHI36_003415 [Cryptolaemus montrouzieri]|uniref:Myb-like domain-containing protein n=1 Tax=Cryptolaemus montrouzieri TaxID=559131 RepID=A0ABD2PE27_9CUCU
MHKKFRTKKCMWEQIANDINSKLQLNKTALQVENRFKTLLRKKDYEVKYRTASLDDDYKEKIKKILLERSSKRKFSSNDALCNTQSIERDNSLQETLEKIHIEKEKAKERRHREKLKLLRKHEAAKERRHHEKLEMMRELIHTKVISTD